MADNTRNPNDPTNSGSIKPSSTTRRDRDVDVTRDPDAPDARDANRDPITGAPGAHPVGSGVGAALGGAAAGIGTGVGIGAAAGAIGGPVGVAVGTAVGTIVGGVVGGLVGKNVAEHVNPTIEHAHWRTNYQNRPYYQKGQSYDQYGPAYQYGWESRAQHGNKSFEEAEPDLRQNWATNRGNSSLSWEHAKEAVRDSWNRTHDQITNSGSTTGAQGTSAGGRNIGSTSAGVREEPFSNPGKTTDSGTMRSVPTDSPGNANL